jgi:hypothetical protein
MEDDRQFREDRAPKMGNQKRKTIIERPKNSNFDNESMIERIIPRRRKMEDDRRFREDRAPKTGNQKRKTKIERPKTRISTTNQRSNQIAYLKLLNGDILAIFYSPEELIEVRHILYAPISTLNHNE